MRTLNLGILAHVDAGKTSLTERLLHSAGVIDQIGSVDAGSTQTDSLALERQRGITIKSAVVSFAIGDITVNLIDTPGHPDFIAEVERALSVLDGAVLVISAVEGVQPQTRILMRALQRLRVPAVLFVNKIDRRGAGYDRVLREISERLTAANVAMTKEFARRVLTRADRLIAISENTRADSIRILGLPPERIAALVAHKVHQGSRPSTVCLFEKLDPPTLGKLIAFYEHKVFTQGVVWGINSFDQWGVELGKVLAERIIPELESKDEPLLGHDSSTNQQIRRYRARRARPSVPLQPSSSYSIASVRSTA